MIHEAYCSLLVMEVSGFRAELWATEKIALGLFELDRAREAKRVSSVMVKRGAKSELASLSSLLG